MWTFILAVTYLIPSLILYFCTVFVIIKNWSKLKSSFFVWYLLDFFMNLLTSSVTFITLKLSSVTCQTCLLSPLYISLQNSIISNFMYCMMYHMSYVQYAITTIISINRLTIIWNHYFFEPLWRNYSFMLIFVVYFLPFISTGQLFSSTCTFGNRSDDTFVLSCDLPTNILFTPLIVFQIICIVCSAACNITSLVLVLRASKEIKQKMEANFFYLISVTSTVLAAGAIISFILSSYPKAPFYSFSHTYVLPFISDLFTVIHPWLLYGPCQPIRKYIHRDIFGQKSSSVDVVPHNSQVGVSNPTGSRINNMAF